MVWISVNIQGIEDLQKHLDPERFERAIDAGLSGAMFALDAGMKEVTPVDTGRLRQSYQIKKRRWLEQRLVNYREYGPIVDARQWFVDKGIRNATPTVKSYFLRSIDKVLWSSQ